MGIGPHSSLDLFLPKTVCSIVTVLTQNESLFESQEYFILEAASNGVQGYGKTAKFAPSQYFASCLVSHKTFYLPKTKLRVKFESFLAEFKHAKMARCKGEQ